MFRGYRNRIFRSLGAFSGGDLCFAAKSDFFSKRMGLLSTVIVPIVPRDYKKYYYKFSEVLLKLPHFWRVLMKIWVKSLLWSPRVSEYPESAEQKMMSLFGEAMINSLIFKCPLSLNPYFTFILPAFFYLPSLSKEMSVYNIG